MTIHREGYTILSVSALLLLIINLFSYYLFQDNTAVLSTVLVMSGLFFVLILQFFRYPSRELTSNEKFIVAPCDGKVVVIEETEEKEYFKDKRKQISIFMSPVNVHVNWYPISGKVTYLRYHEGKYLVAWHPKSSTDNERTTIVIEKENKFGVLVRQIAGALAKRIVYYPREGDMIRQGAELGFIKFGSRVDVFVPLNCKINVAIGQKTVGGVTVLAELE